MELKIFLILKKKINLKINVTMIHGSKDEVVPVNYSKKVSNQKMKSFFNYNLKFPTYIEGLNYIRDHLV